MRGLVSYVRRGGESRRAWRRMAGGAARRGVARRGFTLLEALIALLIVGLAVVATVEAFGGGLRAEREVSRHLEAVALAEARINELALLAPDSLALYAVPREGVFPAPFGQYRWRAVVREEVGSPALLRAAVMVAWGASSYELETVFYKRGRRGTPATAQPAPGPAAPRSAAGARP